MKIYTIDIIELETHKSFWSKDKKSYQVIKSASDSSLEGQFAAEKIDTVLEHLMKKDMSKTHYTFHISAFYFYAKIDENIVYLFSSSEKPSKINVIEQHFMDIAEIAQTKHYEELDKKIKNPSYIVRKIEKIKEELHDFKETMLKNIDDVLNRGEKIENIQIATQTLADESVAFSSAASKLRLRTEPFSEKLKDTFCCFFSSCLKENQEEMHTLTENKYKKYRRN